jgi:hypothetical protein
LINKFAETNNKSKWSVPFKWLYYL